MHLPSIVKASLVVVTLGHLSLGAEAFPQESCLTDSLARKLSDDFTWMVASWKLNTTKSEEILLESMSPTVVDWSGSVRNLVTSGCSSAPQPLTSGRDAFAADQLAVEAFEMNVAEVWHSCDIISYRWIAPLARNVTGLVVLQTVPAQPGSASHSRIIQNIWSEFDTASFLASVGLFHPANCTQ